MNYKHMLCCAFVTCGLAIPGTAQTKEKEKGQVLDVSEKVKSESSIGLGYLKGKELANELLKSGYQLDDFAVEELMKGFGEALRGKDSSVQAKNFKVAIDLMKAKLQERELKVAKENLVKSKAWLTANAKEKGVKTTASGLQYQVMTAGKGEVFKAKELKKGEVDKRRFLIHYRSSTVDGVVFEQLPKGKIVAVGEDVLPGLGEALKMMPVGSKWKLFLKPELAYGEQRLGALIKPNSVVVMEVELLGIKAIEVRK